MNHDKSWLAKVYVLVIRHRNQLVVVVIPLGKDDVKYVRFSSNGMDYGVHVVDTGSEQSHATW